MRLQAPVCHLIPLSRKPAPPQHALYKERAGKSINRVTTLWDQAHDFTLDKFTLLPEEHDKQCERATSSEDGTPHSRVDCKNYYAALLEMIQTHSAFCATESALEQDAVASTCFQKFVNRHFYLSYLEAKRRENPLVSRYVWAVDGKGKLTLWMPKYLAGKRRAEWLVRNVQNPDPSRPGERDRVQNIINKRLVIPRFVGFESEEQDRCPSAVPLPDAVAGARLRPTIVDFLAREKALAADMQRPAIRKLGPEKVEALVRCVVRNLTSRSQTDEEIAAAFGVSKTALSHFAGSCWAEGKDGRQKDVPDLWRNLATLLSRSEVFQETAKEAGVWPAVQATIQNNKRPARLKGEEYAR